MNHRAIMKWVIPAGGECCKCSIEANRTGKPFLKKKTFFGFKFLKEFSGF